MKKSRLGIAVAVLVMVAVAAVCLFVVRIPISPPDGMRVIVEKTHQTLIAPACFEKAETTNNLTEGTYKQAKELGYKPEAICTADLLKPQSERLITAIAQKLQLAKGKWDE